jgi:hypothetical protein
LADRPLMLFVLDLAETAHDVEQPPLSGRQIELVLFEALEEVLKRSTQSTRDLIEPAG